MDINKVHNVYFIGIGGIGMSAIALYFKAAGKHVSGYDKTPSEVTDSLAKAGICIHFNDDVNNIPKECTPENTLVVITPAIPQSHSEWKYFIDNKYNIKKRAGVLGIITKDTFCFAVAGTHGKTTTSAILGHILYQSGADVTAFVGGIVENYNSNLIGNGKTVSVVEADEFDRSFLQLHPNIACITSIDSDHLDIYGTGEEIRKTFLEFADKISDKSKLFLANKVPFAGVSCSIDEDTTYKAVNVRLYNGDTIFDIETPTETIKDFRLSMPGKHNLMNALMASAMALTYGISPTDIAKALLSFRGIKRRFSYQIKTENLVFIDDYAHHPTEINALSDAIKGLYPGKRTLGIFQPHLYSRTRDFIDDFAKSLSAFDEVILLDIYPARELPIEGVSSDWLLSKMDNKNKKLVTKQELISSIMESKATVIATIGAGDIGELVISIKESLEKNV